MNKKNARKKKRTVPLAVVLLPDVQSGLRAQTLMWLLLCCLFYFSSRVCVVQFWFCWVVSRTRAAEKAQRSHRGALFPPVFLWAFAKHLGCCFPFVCVQCCAFWPVLCTVVLPSYHEVLSYLKKAQRHPPEVKWSLACFLLLVFQWEASQTNPPSLHYLLWYLQNDDQLLSLCHRFWAKSTHNPSSLLEGQNCVWICCRERSTAGSRFPSSAFILVKLQQCTCYHKSIWL